MKLKRDYYFFGLFLICFLICLLGYQVMFNSFWEYISLPLFINEIEDVDIDLFYKLSYLFMILTFYYLAKIIIKERIATKKEKNNAVFNKNVA